MLLLALVLTLAAPLDAGVALAAPPHSGTAWRWPLRGEVLTPFHVVANRFAAGQHRGIDIAAAAGASVRSACDGRVRFAGRLPGRGRVASIVCGDLVATYLELGSLTVRRGDTVGAGAPIGTVAASHLQLGARRAAGGYLDPLTLLRDPSPPPLGAAPARRIRWQRPPPAATPRGVVEPRPSAAAERRVPLLAWAGLGLLVAGTPAGALYRRTRRRRRGVARAAHEGA